MCVFVCQYVGVVYRSGSNVCSIRLLSDLYMIVVCILHALCLFLLLYVCVCSNCGIMVVCVVCTVVMFVVVSLTCICLGPMYTLYL